MNKQIKHSVIGSLVLIATLFSGQLFTQTHTFNIAWDDPNPVDNQVIEYVVYESIDNGANYIEFARVNTPDQIQEVTVQIGTNMHRYVVTAVNMIGLESDYSNVLKVQTNKPLDVISRKE